VPDTIASLNAMEWCIANKTKYNIRVVNMSFGLGSIPNGNSPETKLADKMVDAGIVVVVSAGNAGPGSGTIGTPGDAKNAITVGAVQDRTTIGAWQFSKASPSMAVFSSRGPTSDGRAKPDVVAPGVSVIVARFGSDTQYEYTNGTSYSSPYTAGACALIIQRHPNWHPVHVKQALIATASPVSGAGQYDQGAGLINIYRAINYRQPFEGLPIAQILKIVKGNQNKE
jgi:serine protease AprX